MFKEYRLTIFAVVVFTAIITFGLKGATKQHIINESKIEIPLPLENISEQILYRKGYTVSYNKDHKIPNWVAWHLTAEHTTGPFRRPTSAWHEDMQVPYPRALIADYRESGWTGDIYIVCGPILFRQPHETIGPNKVVVPEAFFKVVLCLNGTPKGIGFICRNTDGGQRRDFYVNSIRQVERITSMTFFPSLSKEIETQVKDKANLDEWEKGTFRWK